MPAIITELIDKNDTFEVVADQIAAILVLETANQKLLAQQASEEPRDWDLAIFQDRSNPWEQWLQDPEEFTDDLPPPVVNVWFDHDNENGLKSNSVEKQGMEAVYNLDCYGYGISTATGGHDLGDELANRSAKRAARLVRNILMSGHYTCLGLRGTVGRRRIRSRTAFQPKMTERPPAHVMAIRLELEVHFNELSPQVQGTPLSLITVEVRKDTTTGQILAQADFPQP